MHPTVNDQLHILATTYGNDWPEHALALYVNMEIAARNGVPNDHAFRLGLREWVLDNIKAGLAFRQAE